MSESFVGSTRIPLTKLNPSLRGVLEERGEKARICDEVTGRPICEHVHDRKRLLNFLMKSYKTGPSCPLCKTIGQGSAELADELFDAFNLRPNKFAAHDPIPEVDGPPPHFEDGSMMWRPGDGRRGKVPMRNGERLPIDRYHGMQVADVPHETVTEFRIAYTIAYPATRRAGDLDDLPLIGLLHGVPMNRRLKYRVMRELGKFAVVVAWDMLGMGESDQVLDYELGTDSGREVNEAWDWKHDVPYIHELMTEHIPARLQMKRKKWVFQR